MKGILLFGIALTSGVACAGEWADYFSFEEVPKPAGIDTQVGAMDALEDGRIAVAFHRGEVMIYEPKTEEWSLFASGLQEPLGMVVEDERNILVMQRAELTRLRDLDGNGAADDYETVTDAFGMTGNYHEFSYGPARDEEGNLYIALGVASNGAPIREEIRGEFLEIGKMSREDLTRGEGWHDRKAQAGRMYSRAPYRGWVMKISPDGSKVEPYASGFRSPNGIGFDAKGRLLITDNQGDWRPTSPLYDVHEGRFYGHPASLPWTEGWDGRDPLDLSAEELDAMHEQPVGYFPQGELANSPTWPVVLPEKGFPEGMARQTVIGEMNQPTLIRVLDDEVDGVYQTGLVPFLDHSPLGIGNNRIAFGSDGAMYVGKTALSWAGGTGITKVKWNGKEFPFVESISAQVRGFRVVFSEEIAKESLNGVRVMRHTYHYHADYGSDKVNEEELKVDSAELSENGRTLDLEVGGLKERYLHLVDLGGIKTVKGGNVLGDKVWYYVLKAPK